MPSDAAAGARIDFVLIIVSWMPVPVFQMVWLRKRASQWTQPPADLRGCCYPLLFLDRESPIAFLALPNLACSQVHGVAVAFWLRRVAPAVWAFDRSSSWHFDHLPQNRRPATI